MMRMTKVQTTVIATGVALGLASLAQADVTLNSVRVAAADTVALAGFYQSAFGMHEVNRDSDAVEDPIAHVIVNVTDMTGTVAAVKAAGGSILRDPFEFGNSGLLIGIAADPAGNQIELIQPAP